MKMYGAVPEEAYSGLIDGRKYYIMLKMMGFTVHKVAVKDLLKKFN